MVLELMAIVVALSTFGADLAGKTVRVFTDNAGGEGALQKGSAKSWDRNLQVHSFWLTAARLLAALWVERVPTKENIADLPSRQDERLLGELGAAWRAPRVPEECLEPAWWLECSAGMLFTGFCCTDRSAWHVPMVAGEAASKDWKATSSLVMA